MVRSILHTRLVGSAAIGVPRVAVIGWLIAFTAFEWLRLKLDAMPMADIFDVLDNFTAVETFEIVMLAMMFLRLPPAPQINVMDAAASVAVAAGLMLMIESKPIFAASLLTFYVLIRFAPYAEYRALSLALFAFIAQYWMQAGPFIWLHEVVGSIDADVLRWAFRISGHAVAGSGTIVIQISQNHATDIMVGCASSFSAAIVATGFVIAILGLRGHFQKSDTALFIGLMIATVLLNWIRLYPTMLSHAGWEYWHEGNGATLIAAAYALLILAFVQQALHARSDQSRPA